MGTVQRRRGSHALLQSDASYGQIKEQFWSYCTDTVKELNTPKPAYPHVPDLENQVKTLTDKLNNIDTTWNQRTADTAKVAQSVQRHQRAKKNQKLKNELIVAQKKVSTANLQLDDKQRTIIMQWFMYGGVLGIGLLLGLVLLPHMIPSRKRKDRWMN